MDESVTISLERYQTMWLHEREFNGLKTEYKNLEAKLKSEDTEGVIALLRILHGFTKEPDFFESTLNRIVTNAGYTIKFQANNGNAVFGEGPKVISYKSKI